MFTIRGEYRAFRGKIITQCHFYFLDFKVVLLQKFVSENGEKYLKLICIFILSSNILILLLPHSKLPQYRLDFLLKAIIWIKCAKLFSTCLKFLWWAQFQQNVVKATVSQLKRKLVKRVLAGGSEYTEEIKFQKNKIASIFKLLKNSLGILLTTTF